MSPGREDETAETTHLVEQTVEEALAATHALVVVLLKVNVDESPALAARYGIRSIPTLLLFKEGTLLDRVVGAAPQTVLQGIVSLRAS